MTHGIKSHIFPGILRDVTAILDSRGARWYLSFVLIKMVGAVYGWWPTFLSYSTAGHTSSRDVCSDEKALDLNVIPTRPRGEVADWSREGGTQTLGSW